MMTEAGPAGKWAGAAPASVGSATAQDNEVQTETETDRGRPHLEK